MRSNQGDIVPNQGDILAKQSDILPDQGDILANNNLKETKENIENKQQLIALTVWNQPSTRRKSIEVGC